MQSANKLTITHHHCERPIANLSHCVTETVVPQRRQQYDYASIDLPQFYESSVLNTKEGSEHLENTKKTDLLLRRCLKSSSRSETDRTNSYPNNGAMTQTERLRAVALILRHEGVERASTPRDDLTENLSPLCRCLSLSTTTSFHNNVEGIYEYECRPILQNILYNYTNGSVIMLGTELDQTIRQSIIWDVQEGMITKCIQTLMISLGTSNNARTKSHRKTKANLWTAKGNLIFCLPFDTSSSIQKNINHGELHIILASALLIEADCSNGKIFDALQDDPPIEPLKSIQMGHSSVLIEGITFIRLWDNSDLINLLTRVNQRRQTCHRPFHCVLSIIIETCEEPKKISIQTRIRRLSFIDLADSSTSDHMFVERVSHHVENPINLISHLINRLSTNTRHISHSNFKSSSTLTSILKDAIFGGSSSCCLISLIDERNERSHQLMELTQNLSKIQNTISQLPPTTCGRLSGLLRRIDKAVVAFIAAQDYEIEEKLIRLLRHFTKRESEIDDLLDYLSEVDDPSIALEVTRHTLVEWSLPLKHKFIIPLDYKNDQTKGTQKQQINKQEEASSFPSVPNHEVKTPERIVTLSPRRLSSDYTTNSAVCFPSVVADHNLKIFPSSNILKSDNPPTPIITTKPPLPSRNTAMTRQWDRLRREPTKAEKDEPKTLNLRSRSCQPKTFDDSIDILYSTPRSSRASTTIPPTIIPSIPQQQSSWTPVFQKAHTIDPLTPEKSQLASSRNGNNQAKNYSPMNYSKLDQKKPHKIDLMRSNSLLSYNYQPPTDLRDSKLRRNLLTKS